MKLKEIKIKTFSLIEEYYPDLKGFAEDEDVLNKINGVVNQIQLDLMKYRKINASKEVIVTKEDAKVINIKNILGDCYQINVIKFDNTVEYEMPNDEIIVLPNDFEGKFTIYYFKYPKLVKTIFEGTETEIEEAKEKEDNEYEFELDLILLEIMPYGIASDLLKMDMISGYGKYFYERYLEMKNNIDTRRTSGMVSIVGGVDI